MARQKLDTLQIKNFKGVDRFTEGTEQEPDVFYDIQNFYEPNPGELRAINGVTKLTSSTLSGVSKILYAKFLDTQPEKDLVIFYRPTETLPSAPSGFTFATSGGGAVAKDLYVEYITPGGGRTATKYTTSIQANGLTVTIPANIDPLVRCINYWITDGSTKYVWCGSSFRINGVFPTSILLFYSGTAISSPNIVTDFPCSKPTFSGTTGGSLQSGRIYYFGISPWAGFSTGFYAACNWNISNTNLTTTPISYFLPDGYNSINFTMDFCPFNPSNTNASPINSDTQMDRAIVYMGVTQEDLLPCGDTNGNAVTYAKTPVTYTVADVNSDVTVATPGTVVITGYQVPVGAILKYTAGTGSITGLTSGSYYYVISAVYSASGTTVTLGNTPTSTAIAFTAKSGAGTTVTFKWSKVTGTVSVLPNSMELIPSAGKSASNSAVLPTAIAGRTAGYLNICWQSLWNKLEFPYTENQPPNTYTTTPYSIGCMIFTGLDMSTRRDVLYPMEQHAVNLTNYSWISSDASSTLLSNLFNMRFLIPLYNNSLSHSNLTPDTLINWSFQGRQYGGRLWFTNGFNEPFYTNGYVLKSGIVSDPGANTAARWPITKFIEFYKDRMILGSDTANNTYQQSILYYSKYTTGSPDIQDFSYNGTTPNFLPISSGDSSILMGLNIYSQDLTSVGAESFLVVGKQASVFTWDGSLSTVPKQVARASGFAGPNCYAISRFGPVYVGQDNVYLFQTSDNVVPIGDPIKDIIKGLTSDQLKAVVALYHNEDVKIGYQDSSDIDREIWLRMKYTGQGLNRYWTGPHVLKSYQGVTNILSFDSQKEVRISFLDTDIYQRDDQGSWINDGLDIARRIKIRNLGLQQDHLLKVIDQVFLALRTVQDETFDITLESEDGSDSIVISSTQISSGNAKKAKQFLVPQRFLARVLTMTIENTSNADMSIYDFSILYQTIRRRLLP